MAAGTYNILIEQGATYDQTFTYTISGSPVNLTGYTARMQARQTHASPTKILDLVSPTNITLGDAAGTVRVVVAATATDDLNAGTYVYDLELESGSGVVTRLIQGSLTVSPEVTR